jgi:hypothetical protein
MWQHDVFTAKSRVTTRLHEGPDRARCANLYEHAVNVANLTALALSCTARAYVIASSGAAAAAHSAGQQRVICSRRDTALVLFGPGGSAAGPKPGRASFSL